jgi:hypothetical protein
MLLVTRGTSRRLFKYRRIIALKLKSRIECCWRKSRKSNIEGVISIVVRSPLVNLQKWKWAYRQAERRRTQNSSCFRPLLPSGKWPKSRYIKKMTHFSTVYSTQKPVSTSSSGITPDENKRARWKDTQSSRIYSKLINIMLSKRPKGSTCSGNMTVTPVHNIICWACEIVTRVRFPATFIDIQKSIIRLTLALLAGMTGTRMRRRSLRSCLILLRMGLWTETRPGYTNYRV